MTGSLQTKNRKYYVVVAYKDEFGKDKRKWYATGLEEKGNKRKAEEKLKEIIRDFENGNLEVALSQNKDKGILFGDYLQQWLLSIKNNVEEITYESYGRNINIMKKYFNEKQVYLNDLKPYNIQEFYNHLYQNGRSGNTAVHYHVLIRQALQNAVKLEMIDKNVADFVDRPKKDKYQAEFYNKQELMQLFEVVKGDPLELVIYITAYYGLRRSEVIGLKWSAIDFENKMVKINHKVVKADGILIGKNKMKNKTSNRTLPLIPQIENLLRQAKQTQENNRKLCGRSYNTKYLDYICVNPMGELLSPDYLSQHFRIIQNNFGLKHIRFHDLRHSCASLMLANGVPMKQIQEWLGHSTFQTTADIYAHLDYSSKISSANTISNALTFEEIMPTNDNKELERVESFEEIEQDEYDLDDEIRQLEEELERKRERKRRRQEEAEM